MRLVVPYALLVVVLAACADERALRRMAAGDGWTVDTIPVVDIADTTMVGEPVLLYAADATRLSDGSIVVADAYASAVRYFSPEGRPLRTVGRPGSGPGEFSPVWWVAQCAVDSVFVWEPEAQRMRVLDGKGTIAREFQWPVPPVFQSCSRQGVFALQSSHDGVGMPRKDSPHYTGPVWLADAAGDTVLRVGELPFVENRPLGKATKLVVTAERLYVATADSGFVDAYTLTGEPSGAIAVGGELRAPNARHYDRALDAWVVQFPDRQDREEMKKRLRQMLPMPPRMPAYSDVHADPEGNLWTVLSAPGDAETRLRAVGPNGRVLADIVIPRELVIFEIGSEYVLGRYEDPEEGTHHVVLYRLRRAA